MRILKKWLVVATPLVAAMAMAQTVVLRGNAGGYGVDSAYTKLFNPQTVVTFSGKITGITTSPPMNGMDPGMTVIVRADNGGSMLVEVGPLWYVNNQPTKLRMGDRVTVTGSKLILDRRGMVVASAIRKGRSTLVLRDAAGLPYWAATRVISSQAAAEAPIVADLNGVVVRADVIEDGQAGVPSRAVVVRTQDGSFVTVDLGPQWFIDRQDINLLAGQTIGVQIAPNMVRHGGVVVASGMYWNNNANALILRRGTVPVWIWGGG